MIAGKQKPVLVKHDHVPAGVPGNRNGDQIVIDPKGISARYYLFDTEACRAVVSMHDPSTSELPGKALVIGNIILVRQKHGAHAAHGFDLFYELRRESR